MDPRKRRFCTKVVRSRSSSQENHGGGDEGAGGGNIDLDITNSQSHRFQRERNSVDSGPECPRDNQPTDANWCVLIAYE